MKRLAACGVRMALGAVLAWGLPAGGSLAAEIQVDTSVSVGTIRPLHGVNNGPLNMGETVDLSVYYRTLAPPLVRLHDCEWPAGYVVDFHAVFPNPQADPESPASYTFGRTDDYVGSLAGTGAGIVYRLGESIEHTRRKLYVHPPADYPRWSAACLGIIRHYNQGWAEGFRHGIRYWEVWNEPENRPAMWSGSDEDYYRLYAMVSRAIKTEFPELCVGGPSVGTAGQTVDGRWEPTPFVRGFLTRCRDDKLPLDFFSWHTYTSDPALYAEHAKAVRGWLDAFGFARTEIHLNEWNYLPDDDWGPMGLAGQGEPRQRFYGRIGGPEGAAFSAEVLVRLQDSPVDVANYYAGDTNQFGLFDRNGAPKSTYYAFLMFRRLLDTPVRLRTEAGGAFVVLAGTNRQRNRLAVLIVRRQTGEPGGELAVAQVPWSGPSRVKVERLDPEHATPQTIEQTLPPGPLRLPISLSAPGIVLAEIAPAD